MKTVIDLVKKNPDNYSKEEYCKALLNYIQDDFENDEIFYHFVLFSDYGLEGYKVVKKESEISTSTISAMKLRARYNSQRNLNLYGFAAKREIPEEDINIDFINEYSILI